MSAPARPADPPAPEGAGAPGEPAAGGLARRLLRDSFVYGMGAVATRFVAFFLIPVYTRLFSPAEYGLLDLLLATSTVFALLGELQVSSGFGREYHAAAAAGRVPALVRTALGVYLRSTVLSAAALAGYAAWAALGSPPVGWAAAVPVALNLPLQLFTLFQTVFRYERRPHAYAAISVGDVATSAALSVAAVAWLGLGVPGVLWGLLLSKLLWGGVLAWRRRELLRGAWDPALARRVLGYGVPLLPAVLSKWGQNYASRYVLALSLSVAALGYFSLAARLASVLAMVDMVFRAAWDPHAMSLFGRRGSEPVFARVLDAYLAGLFAACAALAFLGAPLVRLVAGAGYAPAGPLVGFLAFGLLWNGAAGILAAGNAWERRTAWNGLGFAAGAALNVLLLAWAAPRWGLAAAGATYLLATLVSAGIVLATAERNHPIPYDRAALALAAAGSWAVAWGAWALDRSAAFAALPPFENLGVRLLLAALVALPLALRLRGRVRSLRGALAAAPA